MSLAEALARVQSRRSQRSMSFLQSPILEEPLEKSPSQKAMSELEEMYPDGLVTIKPDDPEFPHNWSTKKRVTHTLMFGVTTLSAQAASTILSPAVRVIAKEYDVGVEVGVLAMSIYVLGNGLGPMIFAPLSEVYGRKTGVFIPYFFSAFLMIVIANVNSIAAITVFRFFAGVFAAAPIVSSGGAMADLWPAKQRASALVLYGACIVAGSAMAPTFGALLVEHAGSYGWRWSCWLAGLLGMSISLGNFLFLNETYLPTLQSWRARDIRHDTGQWNYHAKHEEYRLDLGEFFTLHCLRPILMFSTPIVLLMSTYASFVYGVMFLIITSVGTEFSKVHHFGPTTSYVPLICTFIGFLIGGAANVVNSQYYSRKMATKGVTPEDRLIAIMALGYMFAAGCFVYAWTMSPSIHWIVPCIGLCMLGLGIAVIFQGALVYIVDAYTRYAASAIAAQTLLRSIFGGVFPLFSTQMYDKLGTHWAGSLIGFVGIALIPIPYLFYIYGPRIRKISPFEKALQ